MDESLVSGHVPFDVMPVGVQFENEFDYSVEHFRIPTAFVVFVGK